MFLEILLTYIYRALVEFRFKPSLEDREFLIGLLETSTRETYANWLSLRLGRLDHFIRKLGGLKSDSNPYNLWGFFRGWYPIAVIYTFSFLLAGYLFGGPFVIGGKELDPSFSFLQRLVVCLGIIFCVSIFAVALAITYFTRYAQTFAHSLGFSSIATVVATFSLAMFVVSCLAIITYIDFYIIGVAAIYAIGGFEFFQVAISSFDAEYFSIAIIALKVSGITFSIAILTAAIAIAVGAGVAAGAAVAIIFITLFLLPLFGFSNNQTFPIPVALVMFTIVLPCLNVLFDWISWLVSRGCLQRVERSVSSPSWGGLKAILFDIFLLLLDLFFAFFLLFSLFASVVVCTALLNAGTAQIYLAFNNWLDFLRVNLLLLFDQTGGSIKLESDIANLNAMLSTSSKDFVPIDLQVYFEAARAEPFGAGLFVTGMLATTLLPTFLHFVMGSIALFRLQWLENLLGKKTLIANLRGGGVTTHSRLRSLSEILHVFTVRLFPPLIMLVIFGIALWYLASSLDDFFIVLAGLVVDFAECVGDWAKDALRASS